LWRWKDLTQEQASVEHSTNQAYTAELQTEVITKELTERHLQSCKTPMKQTLIGMQFPSVCVEETRQYDLINTITTVKHGDGSIML